MFRPSSTISSPNLFSNINDFLSGSSKKIYLDPNGWHNIFRRQVVARIDESIFRPLFSAGQGAPNAPIRIVVGMMILKEAKGLSDAQLFSDCQFDLLTRSALGLINIDDTSPVQSTYYLFRKRIVKWEEEHQENLIEKVFSQVTKSQAVDFHVHGKRIRMDSKLIGSNIAWYSRYELIHETLRKACRSLKGQMEHLSLSEADISLLKAIEGESGDKVSYRSSKAELETSLTALGVLIYKIIKQTGERQIDTLCTLRRVFHDQYQVESEVVQPRPKSEISANSVQSPHDTDCHYRNKDGNEVKGYSVNITETCDSDNPLNLITDVCVDVAGAADNGFLEPAIESTQAIVPEQIEIVNADGAYHSIENQCYCKENDIDLVLGAIQGKPSRYDLSVGEDGALIVTDLETGMIVASRKVEPRKEDAEQKWVILNDKNKHRYFTQKDVDTCLLRKQIAARTQEELNVRNNVEATIFQLGYHYSNDKSRYRGLVKHKIWANIRCLWVNFVRIAHFVARIGSNCVQKARNRWIFPHPYAQIFKIHGIIARFVFLDIEKHKSYEHSLCR